VEGKPRPRATSKQQQGSKDRKLLKKMSEKDWQAETGMGVGARADALGDGDDLSDRPRTASPKPIDGDERGQPILPEAHKGNMLVESNAKTKEGESGTELTPDQGHLTDEDIDKMKEADRKGFSEVY
jgi:hypothetical protein